MGQPRPLFSFHFGLLKHTLQFLQQINVKKFHVNLVEGAEEQDWPNIQPYLLTVTKRRSSLIYVVLQQTSFEDASNRQDRGARSAFFFRSPPRFRELGGSADAATRATLEMG